MLGRVWIRIFPDMPVSKKPAEVRMGKGKGSVELWVCRVKPGRIVFEIDGVAEDLAAEAIRLGAAKLPVGHAVRAARAADGRGGGVMKAADLRAKTQDQLQDQLVQLKKEQFNLRFQKATGQLESTARVRQVRREIARIKTVLVEPSRGAGLRRERRCRGESCRAPWSVTRATRP